MTHYFLIKQDHSTQRSMSNNVNPVVEFQKTPSNFWFEFWIYSEQCLSEQCIDIFKTEDSEAHKK